MKYLAALAFLALPLLAQEAQFGEKVDVNAVLIDAIVTDSRGNQILGLDKGDFVLKENGTPQTIESVDYFTNRKLLNAQEQSAPFKVEQVKEGRYFVFFFDKPVGTQLFSELMQARNAARDFIKQQMLPGDQVAIVAHDFRLKVFSDFTTDKAQLQRALEQVVTFGNGLKPGGPAGSAPSILANITNIDHSGTVYEALELLGDSLRPIKARKNVVLFSAGILEPGEEVRNGVVISQSQYYQPMIRALNRANVTVYPINLIHDPQAQALPPALHQTLERIASETNGEYFRYPVSFTTPLKKIEKTNNGYYLITYTARHPRGTSGFQRVDVSTKNPEFRIKAREGYVYGD